MSRPSVPRLLAISDRAALGERPLEDWLDGLVDAGVDTVQIREKDLPDRELFGLAHRIRRRLPERVAVLVNGRLDIALAAGCQGVHLPVTGLAAGALRAWAGTLGPEILIGRSTHGVEEVLGADQEGADYVTFGPVFPTPSKARYGPPPGLDGLRAAASLGVPVIALGGVDAARLDAVAQAGATGVAGIRTFHEPAALEALREAARGLFGDRSRGGRSHGRFRDDV